MNLKRFVIVVLTLCLALCLCACGGDSETATTAPASTAAAANSGNGGAATEPKGDNAGSNATTKPAEEPTEPDTKVEYTIKVVDFEGNPVEGVRVQMCVGELCKTPLTTDAQGVVTAKYDVDIYEVKVSNVPANMQAPAVPAKLYEEDRELTIELQRKVLEYVVRVTDEGGNPVSQVTVQFQNQNLSEATTNEEGVASTTGFDVIGGVLLTEVPEGFVAETTEYAFASDSYELTIVLKAVA